MAWREESAGTVFLLPSGMAKLGRLTPPERSKPVPGAYLSRSLEGKIASSEVCYGRVDPGMSVVPALL